MSGSESASKGETDTETAWRIKEHDEAKYNFSDEKGVWQPKPEDILSMFEKLAQGNPLPLKWMCPGRRPPEKHLKPEKNTEDGAEIDDDDSKEEELRAPETSAFDFDEPHIDVNAKLIPKRAPGGLGRTPKTEKRVAKMDNIMKSLHKQQLQRAAEREARKAKGSPSATPPSRSRLLNFGLDDSKHSPNGATGSHSSPASSPRFGGSNNASSSSPLLKRGPTFMTPSAAARKMASRPGTNSASTVTDPRVSEVSGVQTSTFTSAQQGFSFGSIENRLEQVSINRGLNESTVDDLSSALAQPKNTSPLAVTNSVTSYSTKSNSSAPFKSSIVSTSSNMASSFISISPVKFLDKESLSITDLNSLDSSQSYISVTARAAVSTSITTTGANTPIIATAASETHPVPPAGRSTAPTSNVSHADLGMNLENVVPDAAVQDQPSNISESVSSVNPDV